MSWWKATGGTEPSRKPGIVTVNPGTDTPRRSDSALSGGASDVDHSEMLEALKGLPLGPLSVLLGGGPPGRDPGSDAMWGWVSAWERQNEGKASTEAVSAFLATFRDHMQDATFRAHSRQEVVMRSVREAGQLSMDVVRHMRNTEGRLQGAETHLAAVVAAGPDLAALCEEVKGMQERMMRLQEAADRQAEGQLPRSFGGGMGRMESLPGVEGCDGR